MADPRLWTTFDPNLRITEFSGETMHRVVVTHLPTGMQETCGEHGSLSMNRMVAIQRLRRRMGQ